MGGASPKRKVQASQEQSAGGKAEKLTLPEAERAGGLR